MGWENEGDEYTTGDEANAVVSIFRRGGRRRPAPPGPRRVPRPNLAQRPTGRDARLRSFMGMGFTTWPATDATDKQLPVEPQESFEGRRLIIDVLASGGTSAGLN